MLKVAVLVSGGGTNLQAILDAVDSGKITNTEIRVVISNNEGAYALERAKNYGTEGLLLSPKSFETREEFNQKLLEALKERQIDLVVLAGYLVVVPPCVIQEYENRIINIHPSLIPSFCGKGCYGLHVHEKALERGVKVSGATVENALKGFKGVDNIDDGGYSMYDNVIADMYACDKEARKIYLEEAVNAFNSRL